MVCRIKSRGLGLLLVVSLLCTPCNSEEGKNVDDVSGESAPAAQISTKLSSADSHAPQEMITKASEQSPSNALSPMKPGADSHALPQQMVTKVSEQSPSNAPSPMKAGDEADDAQSPPKAAEGQSPPKAAEAPTVAAQIAGALEESAPTAPQKAADDAGAVPSTDEGKTVLADGKQDSEGRATFRKESKKWSEEQAEKATAEKATAEKATAERATADDLEPNDYGMNFKEAEQQEFGISEAIRQQRHSMRRRKSMMMNLQGAGGLGEEESEFGLEGSGFLPPWQIGGLGDDDDFYHEPEDREDGEAEDDAEAGQGALQSILFTGAIIGTTILVSGTILDVLRRRQASKAELEMALVRKRASSDGTSEFASPA